MAGPFDNLNHLSEIAQFMVGSNEFKTLSFEGTVKVGLSFLGVVFIIVALSSALVMIGSALQTVEYSCLTGEPLREVDLNNGLSDCPNGEDEISQHQTTKTHNVVSLFFTGLGSVLLIAGFFGLFTKMVADAISAGLFLHVQNESSHSSQKTNRSDSVHQEKVEIYCPSCQSKLAIQASSQPRAIRCPKCKFVFEIDNVILPSQITNHESDNSDSEVTLNENIGQKKAELQTDEEPLSDEADSQDHDSVAEMR